MSTTSKENVRESERLRARNHYFVQGDIVWVRPMKMPYWPAEVFEIEEARNKVRARLINPPSVTYLESNLREEKRQHKKLLTSKIKMANNKKDIKKEKVVSEVSSTCSVNPNNTNGDKDSKNKDSKNDKDSCATLIAKCECTESDSALRESKLSTSTFVPAPDVVTASGTRVYFFDKLRTKKEMLACVEDRLQRHKYNVAGYEEDFKLTVQMANKLVRIILHPSLLQPYAVCAIGVVYSTMRQQVSAPRQPFTPSFAPQTAMIRLRPGFENGLRDLEGFEFIWVLFQFSYAAAMASGEGQQYIERTRAREDAAEEVIKSGKQEHNIRSNDTNVHTKELASKKPANEIQHDANITSSSSTSSSAACCHCNNEEQEENQEEDEIQDDSTVPWRRRQGATRSAGYKVMLIPPRDEQLRGVFATRSPHRPNFIGMSCVRLVAIDGLHVHIADHDLLHGTPVLDIKPYLPFCDAHPSARVGWVEELEMSGKARSDHKSKSQTLRVDRVQPDEEMEVVSNVMKTK